MLRYCHPDYTKSLRTFQRGYTFQTIIVLISQTYAYLLDTCYMINGNYRLYLILEPFGRFQGDSGLIEASTVCTNLIISNLPGDYCRFKYWDGTLTSVLRECHMRILYASSIRPNMRQINITFQWLKLARKCLEPLTSRKWLCHTFRIQRRFPSKQSKVSPFPHLLGPICI